TRALRAKIFGLNAAKVYGISAAEVKKYASRDGVSAEKASYQERAQPHFLTYGPKTRREFLLWRRADTPVAR
ncbi:MAG: amidohydrolase 2, partial [Burkholderiales bacterium]|nr:amidohydrolase 2 [Burkholderiales bacterium]